MNKKFLATAMVISSLTIYNGCSKLTSQNNTSVTTNKSKTEGNKELNKNIYDLSVKTMDGDVKQLSDYKGKVLLIVNVASKCGFTTQYEGLEKIYEANKDKGFEILAFPCNDFGEQEPGSNEEIRTFCESKYNVTFPLFDKVQVLGENKNPLYERLINNSQPAGDIGWNFEKFLIDKEGNIAGRYKSKVKPDSEELTNAIDQELRK